MSKILSNQRYCNYCKESIFSQNRHDYKTCRCGEVMVDGGMEYIRQSIAGKSLNITISDEHFNMLMKPLLHEPLPEQKYMLFTDVLRELYPPLYDFPDNNPEMMEAITDPTRNPLGHLCNAVRVLRDKHDFNIGPDDE